MGDLIRDDTTLGELLAILQERKVTLDLKTIGSTYVATITERGVPVGVAAGRTIALAVNDALVDALR